MSSVLLWVSLCPVTSFKANLKFHLLYEPFPAILFPLNIPFLCILPVALHVAQICLHSPLHLLGTQYTFVACADLHNS